MDFVKEAAAAQLQPLLLREQARVLDLVLAPERSCTTELTGRYWWVLDLVLEQDLTQQIH